MAGARVAAAEGARDGLGLGTATEDDRDGERGASGTYGWGSAAAGIGDGGEAVPTKSTPGAAAGESSTSGAHSPFVLSINEAFWPPPVWIKCLLA